MIVTYFYRNIASGYSISRVFKSFTSSISSKKEYDVPYAGANIISLFKNMLYVYHHQSKDGINHITGDIHYCSLILPSKNTILTVHDIVALKRSKKTIAYWLLYFFWLYLPLRHLRYVTCISNKTKKELIELFPWSEDKLIVIHNPLDERFIYYEKEFNLKKPVVLHVGTKPNKNLNRVIEALRGISCHLRVIGPLEPAIQELLLKNNIEYSNGCNLSDQQILEEYQKCDIVSFPSLYEGFGLPMLEGFGVGRVVVTSSIEPMQTLSAGGAILVNPNDVASIRDGFLTAITDKPLRDALIKKGLSVAQKFTPQNIAEQYNHIYRNVLRNIKV